MSTDHDRPGGKEAAAAALAQSKAMVEQAAREEEQLELLEPLTADEIDGARERLGPGAGLVSVMREARKGRGRPKGVRNRRTDDFDRYISQFGQDPAITLMQIQSTAPEELVARSRMLDTPKRQMTYADAQALRVRCAEALMPFKHSKKPVAVDATIRGVMVVEEISQGPRPVTIDGEGDPLGVLPIGDGGEPDE